MLTSDLRNLAGAPGDHQRGRPPPNVASNTDWRIVP